MSDCLFCRIAAKEMPSNIVYEDNDFLAFHDISPKAPVHVLIIPKKHLPDLDAADEVDLAMLGRLNLLAKNLAAQLGINESGYRLLTNCKSDSGQIVFHLHYHLLGGRFLGDICEP